MDIDIKTLVLFFLLLNAINSALLFVLWRLHCKHFRGLFLFFVSMCLQTIGLVFLFLHGILPDYLIITIASVLPVSGLLFVLDGFERFFNKKKRHIYNYVIISVFSFLTVYFTIENNNLLARNVCVSALIILFASQTCLLLSYRVEPNFRRATRFTAGTLLAYCVLSIGRILALFLIPGQYDEFFSSGIVNSVSMMVYGSLGILITLGIIMMVSQRLLDEIQTEKDKYEGAFHFSPYALLLTRISDGKIFEVNEGFIRTTGYLQEEVVGKTTLAIGLWANPNDRAEFVIDMMSGDVHEKTMKFQMKNGETKIGLISAKRISAYGENCALSSFSDITEMVKTKEELENMALHDTLTGLPNRQLLFDRAIVAFANARREKSNIAIISLDVDGLKLINDHWGHAAGDQALSLVGKRVNNLLRKVDTVSRFGGDEFLILLSGIHKVEDVYAIVDKILRYISEPFEVEGNQIVITASLGVAIYPDDDSDIQMLIRKSDEAMYFVKTHGRNGYKFYCDMGR